MRIISKQIIILLQIIYSFSLWLRNGCGKMMLAFGSLICDIGWMLLLKKLYFQDKMKTVVQLFLLADLISSCSIW